MSTATTTGLLKYTFVLSLATFRRKYSSLTEYKSFIGHKSTQEIFVSFLLQGSKVRYKDAKIQARKYLSKQVHIWY